MPRPQLQEVGCLETSSPLGHRLIKIHEKSSKARIHFFFFFDCAKKNGRVRKKENMKMKLLENCNGSGSGSGNGSGHGQLEATRKIKRIK